MSLPPEKVSALRARLGALGRTLGERESAHSAALREAERRARLLHGAVRDAVASFQSALADAGGPALTLSVSEPRTDDKHVRAIEIELRRGRNLALIVAKSRGDVTLVGPFHAGKEEGPCQKLAWDVQDELFDRLGEFLERFLGEALTP